MIRKAFIDSDIILDVATGRKPFSQTSVLVLTLCESVGALGHMSSNSVTNIYYVLRKISSSAKAKDFLRTLLRFITVIPVSHENVKQALDADFPDFEDAVQHYCALSNQCDCIVTRNEDDYRKSRLAVLSPQEFISRYT